MQFLNLIEAIANHVTADNVDKFVSLVEGLIKIAEQAKESSQSAPSN
jgi:hypothetical protein